MLKKIVIIIPIFSIVFYCLLFCSIEKNNELTISAAASLKPAFNILSQEFQKKHPGVSIHLNYGASGLLSFQIEQGAPVDIFASASEIYMTKLAQKKLFEINSLKRIAKNQVVLAFAKGIKSTNKNTDLLKLSKICIGNPKSVPAGLYAIDLLKKLQIYQTLVQTNKLVFADDSSQIINYLVQGEVDAAIVYFSDIHALNSELEIITFDDMDNMLVNYDMAILASSNKHKLAQEFETLVLSDYGQKILKEKGFITWKAYTSP